MLNTVKNNSLFCIGYIWIDHPRPLKRWFELHLLLNSQAPFSSSCAFYHGSPSMLLHFHILSPILLAPQIRLAFQHETPWYHKNGALSSIYDFVCNTFMIWIYLKTHVHELRSQCSKIALLLDKFHREPFLASHTLLTFHFSHSEFPIQLWV